MYYEINVSKKNDKGEYHHYFATHKRSITTQNRLKTVLADFMEKFTKPEFNISVSYVSEVGRSMSAEMFLENPDKLTI